MTEYLDYKHCKRFKQAEKEEHCPLSCVCEHTCIFTLLPMTEIDNNLVLENEELKHELSIIAQEADSQLISLEEELTDAEHQIEEQEDTINEFKNIIIDLPQLIEDNALEEFKNRLWWTKYVDANSLNEIINSYKAQRLFKEDEGMKLNIVAEDRYLPQYANDTDACMDLKAKIQNEKVYKSTSVLVLHENGTVSPTMEEDAELSHPTWEVINPGETKVINTGVQVAIPEGYVMKMYVRSSTGIKKHLCLANGTGIIDSGYRDEIKMALHNFGNESVTIEDGDRICQFIILPFPKVELEQMEDNKEFRHGDRGGGIGSTGQ